MQHAIMLAHQAAERDEVPVGAVVYRGDQIISEGFNLRECDSDPTAHAEVIAVRAAAKRLGEWRLTDCTLAVTLEPCPMCAGALVNARLGRLVYGASDPKAGAVRTLYTLCNDSRLNHSVEVVGGVCAYECGRLLKDFFKQKRAQRQAARRK
ncbi:MAG: nucleoside deaminase [Planctomycetes bacterium]|nr:nucleoside deaminase [Planctomycetota bacterium]NOG53857.1 nucleoside deaminase [Planctomycetota bacterium]